jgi:hypothetical protein
LGEFGAFLDEGEARFRSTDLTRIVIALELNSSFPRPRIITCA